MRVTRLLLGCVIVLVSVRAAAQTASATAPTTQEAPKLTERQASIFLQLANAEANIKAINKALIHTGYNVGLAYEQKEGSEKANELMDRKGGGPVPWDQFYGKTAIDFYHHASADLHYNKGHGNTTLDAQWTGSRLTAINRPPEFDFIYHANTQQMARAQEQIASLLQDQAALLARRQKHEADQSSLWAQLSWEHVKDREVPYQPLYRFALTPPGGHTDLLRGPILFLRTADKAISDALDLVDTDQATAFGDLRHRTKDAYAALQASMADAMFGKDVTPSDQSQAESIKAVCKGIAEVCVVIDDNYRLAMDSDKAKEDSSKLEYRGQLQSSLAKFAELVGLLDERIAATAESWATKPQFGSQSPDQIPAFVSQPRASIAVPQPVAPPPSGPAPSASVSGHDEPTSPEVDPSVPLRRLAALRALWERPALANGKSITQKEVIEGEIIWKASSSGSIDDIFQVGNNSSHQKGPGNFDSHLVIEPGFELDGGKLLVLKGKAEAKGTAEQPIIFRNVEFQGELWGTFEADHAVFDNCSFVRVGGWSTANGYTGKWVFKNCVLHSSSIIKFSRSDCGINMENCAIVDCKFGRRDWGSRGDKTPDVAALVGQKWNHVWQCDFYHCQLSPSAFWLTQRCNFFGCVVADSGSYPSSSDLPLVLGVLPEDHALVDELRSKTSSTGNGHVTYAASAPYPNATGFAR